MNEDAAKLLFLQSENLNKPFQALARKSLIHETRKYYSRTPVTRTLKGSEKQFELAGVGVIGVD